MLDAARASATVYSVPMEALDKGKKFYVRRGLARRVAWEWEGRPTNYGREIRVWNHGTPDQFVDTSRKAA